MCEPKGLLGRGAGDFARGGVDEVEANRIVSCEQSYRHVRHHHLHGEVNDGHSVFSAACMK